MLIFDIALYLRSSSPDADIMEQREVDPSFTPRDAVYALMCERRETYIFKAIVMTPYCTERLWHLSLSLEVSPCQYSARDMVSALWPMIEAEMDPVGVSSIDILALLRSLASADFSLSGASLLMIACSQITGMSVVLVSYRNTNRRYPMAETPPWRKL